MPVMYGTSGSKRERERGICRYRPTVIEIGEIVFQQHIRTYTTQFLFFCFKF
jgi:hypothetical protein